MTEVITQKLPVINSRQNTLVEQGTTASDGLTYRDLVLALKVSRAFNDDQSPTKGEYLRTQFNDFEEAASQTPGYLGSFGTGYPFYANREDGTVVAIEEIDRFIGTVEDKARVATTQELGLWACAFCQRDNDLPDLKTFCRPCEIPQIKPRDVFKALPDLDFWVILDENNPSREATLQRTLQKAGFSQSDIDIVASIKDVTKIAETIESGDLPDKRLPIDLHVVTKPQMIDALTEVRRVVSEVYKPEDISEDNEVPIAPRSLHIVWESVDSPYDFMKDFLFSFTATGVKDPELSEAIEATQTVVRECLSGQDVIDLIGAYPKEMRQMQNPEIRDILLKKWDAAA